jgi:hypothetical protein
MVLQQKLVCGRFILSVHDIQDELAQYRWILV